MRKWLYVFVMLAALAAVTSACNMPGVRSMVPDESETTLTPESDSEGDTGSGEGEEVAEGGCYATSFVADVTIPDGTEFAPGTAFDKTWRLRSVGCMPLPEGSHLIFDHGDSMDGPASAPVPSVAVGEEFEVTVSLTAPDTPGEHAGYWHIVGPSGDYIAQVSVVIAVVGSSDEEPPDEPDPDTPDDDTGGQGQGDQPDLVIAVVSVSPTMPLVNEPFECGYAVQNEGTAPSEASVASIYFHHMSAGVTLTDPIPSLDPGDMYGVTHAIEGQPYASSFWITVTADAENDNDELNESNNELEAHFNIYQIVVHGAWNLTVGTDQCIDLDIGTVACGPGADFEWRLEAGTFNLVPVNGAVATTVGSEPDAIYCSHAFFSSSAIPGSALPVGTNVCVRTSDDRIAAFSVNGRDPSGPLTIGAVCWIIYET